MKNTNNTPDFQITNGFANAINCITRRARDLFDEHPARDKVLNNKVLPTVEAAYILGVCSTAAQLYVALDRANKERGDFHLMPFKIDFEDAVAKYKLAFAQEEDEDEEYEQITIDDILDLMKKKKRRKE